MEINTLVAAFVELGSYIKNQKDKVLLNEIDRAYVQNNWFTPENTRSALLAIADQYLDEKKLQRWTANYKIDSIKPKKVGLVMAGNIPLVGFHDLLCVVITGHTAHIKLSSKDEVLPKLIIDKLITISPKLKQQIHIKDNLRDADAYIASGSNNASRYFSQYFGKYPHIFRRNRNAVAVLTGKETATDIMHLQDDIFRFFGLGCRNVSKLFIPKDYKLHTLLNKFTKYPKILHHNKYRNNYDYYQTIYIMNKTEHMAGHNLLLKEDKQYSSPISVLYYERYESLKKVKDQLITRREDIQCIVGNMDNAIPFGSTQMPSLNNYADDVDTMDFLANL